MSARRVGTYGIDVPYVPFGWEEVTLRDATAEGVADRVGPHTGNITDLPFPDGSFDVAGVAGGAARGCPPAWSRRPNPRSSVQRADT
jgi:hypothetical protein